MNGKNIRMQKLFNKGKNAVIVAIDHGMFDGPIPGMENLNETVKLINPEIDGILLSPGMLKTLKNIFNYKGAPMPIVRINWSDVYCFHWDYNRAKTVIASTVAEAVGNGAEIVLASLVIGTGNPEIDAANIEVYCKLKNQADKLGIPIIGEFFPIKSDQLSPDELHEKVYSSCRMLSELGTDMIKTFYTNDFKKVTETTPVPILGLGASRTATQLEALQLAADEIADGAKGVVFGRNAIQVKDPFNFQAALCDVVKENLPAAEAVKKYNLQD